MLDEDNPKIVRGHGSNSRSTLIKLEPDTNNLLFTLSTRFDWETRYIKAYVGGLLENKDENAIYYPIIL